MPDTNAPDSPVASWGFWIWWVLASTVGWAVGGPVGVALGRPGDIIVAGFVGVALGAMVVGVLQWLVLRRLVGRGGAGRWVPASIAAVAVVGVVVFGVGAVNADVGWVMGAGVFGTVVGVLQWLVLRHEVARAGWWVLASTVGWVAGGPVVGFVSWAVGAPADGPAVGYVGWTALGVVFGVITGSVLVWLLRQRRGIA